MTVGRLVLIALILVAVTPVPSPPTALAAPSPPVADSSDLPIQIEAESGIELQRSARLVIASGNVKAVRGDMDVRADRLSAAYRERQDGSAEVYRLEGDGNVRIATNSETVYSHAASYDLDKELLIANSDNGRSRVRLVTEGGEVTAEQRLEYQSRSRILTARGNAIAVDGNRTIRGDVLTAYLNDSATTGKGTSRFQRVDADGRVNVNSGDETITADRGTYDGARGTATFTGAVKIIRGDSELQGCRAEIDLKRGVSKMFPCEGTGGASGRVRGVIVPGDQRAR